MHRGYVKLWRCIEDSGLVGQPTAFYLYSYLLLKATHKPKSVVVGGSVFNLEPGEAVIGRNKISEATGLSVRQVRTALELLKKLSLIASRTTNKCTVISIVNWDTYQGYQEQNGQQIDQQNGQQAASARPAPGQQAATIQEYKNIRIEEDNIPPIPPKGGEREKRSTRFTPPTPDDVQQYCDERRNGIIGSEFCDFYAARGWMIGKSRMKDWKAAVRTWERKRQETRETVQDKFRGAI